MRYNIMGFPLFEAVVVNRFLSAERIMVSSRSTHFNAANRIVARSSTGQLRARGFPVAASTTSAPKAHPMDILRANPKMPAACSMSAPTSMRPAWAAILEAGACGAMPRALSRSDA